MRLFACFVVALTGSTALGQTEDQAVSPILGIKGSLRYSPFSFVMVVGEVDYERDANGVVFTDTTSAPRALNTVTLRLLLQGRF